MQVQGAGNTAVVKVKVQVQVEVFTWEADERKLQPLSPALPASQGWALEGPQYLQQHILIHILITDGL